MTGLQLASISSKTTWPVIQQINTSSSRRVKFSPFFFLHWHKVKFIDLISTAVSLLILLEDSSHALPASQTDQVFYCDVFTVYLYTEPNIVVIHLNILKMWRLSLLQYSRSIFVASPVDWRLTVLTTCSTSLIQSGIQYIIAFW